MKTKISTFYAKHTALKVSKSGVFSGQHFPVFGLNTEIYSINLSIQSEYRKKRTRKNSVFGQFSHSDNYRLQIFITKTSIFSYQEILFFGL